MARDGSGNYSRVEGPYVNGQVADADEINAEFNDIASALTGSLNTAGTKPMAADLAMGGFKVTGLAAGASNGDAVRYEQLAGFQASDATLTAFAGLTTADDRMLDFTGVDTMAVVSYATVLSNIGAQASDSDLTAIAALTTTAAGRSLLTYADPNADKIHFWDDSAGAFADLALPSALSISGTSLLMDELWEIAVSDETTAITTGTGKAYWVFPYNVTVVSVGASLNTVSSSGTPTFDINEGGTTILSTKITIDANEKTSLTAATAAVISDTTITTGAEMSADIDVAGTGAKGAKIWMIVRRTS